MQRTLIDVLQDMQKLTGMSGDIEYKHELADNLLIEALRLCTNDDLIELIIKTYEQVPKWYA